MIDATPPVTLNSDDYLEASGDAIPSVPWFQFWDELRLFLVALRNAPKQVQQADLAVYLAKLIKTKTQPGVQVWVPGNFQHLMRFDGSAWQFAPGDQGSGYYVDGFSDPPAPLGWAPANGATVSYLRSDGSVGTRVLSTTANRWFRR